MRGRVFILAVLLGICISTGVAMQRSTGATVARTGNDTVSRTRIPVGPNRPNRNPAGVTCPAGTKYDLSCVHLSQGYTPCFNAAEDICVSATQPPPDPGD